MRAKEFITEMRTPWGTPSTIDLENDFMIVDNTKLPKMRFRVITQNLVPLEKNSELWDDLVGNPHDTIYYHVPGDEKDIVALVKDTGAHSNFARTMYVRKDVWNSLGESIPPDPSKPQLSAVDQHGWDFYIDDDDVARKRIDRQVLTRAEVRALQREGLLSRTISKKTAEFRKFGFIH